MVSFKSDPLLAVCKLMTWFLLLSLCFGLLAITLIGGAALFGGARFETALRHSYPQLQDGVASLFVVTAVVIAFAVALTIRFMLLLLALIRSVQAGEAFTLANSHRIRLMAWLSLAGFPVGLCLSLALDLLVNRLGPAAPDAGIHVQRLDGAGVGFSHALVTLLLFVLARLFAQAAAMRDEIERTV